MGGASLPGVSVHRQRQHLKGVKGGVVWHNIADEVIE
jgi:hypothetical protein